MKAGVTLGKCALGPPVRSAQVPRDKPAAGAFALASLRRFAVDPTL